MANFLDFFIQKRSTLAHPDDRFFEAMGVTPNSSGSVVNFKTALGIAAVFACIRNISEDIAKLPIVMSNPRSGGGRDAITDHPVLELVNVRPNPSMTAMSFWETIISHPLGFHGGFGEIVMNSLDEPVQIWPLAPQTVCVEQDEAGTPSFLVRTDKYSARLASQETFHIHGLGLDGVTQWILHQIGATSFGKNIATQEFSATFFGNGANPTGVFEAPPGLKREAIENFKKSFRGRHVGQGKQHGQPVLTDGITYKPISTDPEKSQLLEALQFGVEEVARWYRMPPNKIQHLLRSTYSNIEQENKSYVIDTLQPWSVRVCQEIRRKLLPRNPEILVEHDFSMLLEADVAAKTEALFKEFQMGMHTINDLLIYANRQPSTDPQCNERFVLANIQPLKIAMTQGAKNQNDATAKPTQAPDSAEDSPENDEEHPSSAILAPKPSEKPQTPEYKALLRWYFRKFAHEVEEKSGRAAKRDGGVIEWMKEFFPRNEGYVAETIEIPIRAVLVATGGNPDHSIEIAARMATDYVAEATKRVLAEKSTPIDEFAQQMAAKALEYIKNHEVAANA